MCANYDAEIRAPLSDTVGEAVSCVFELEDEITKRVEALIDLGEELETARNWIEGIEKTTSDDLNDRGGPYEIGRVAAEGRGIVTETAAALEKARAYLREAGTPGQTQIGERALDGVAEILKAAKDDLERIKETKDESALRGKLKEVDETLAAILGVVKGRMLSLLDILKKCAEFITCVDKNEELYNRARIRAERKDNDRDKEE